MAYLQKVPQINPNDNRVYVAQWLKEPGSLVNKGDIIAILETSKAVVELEAEAGGYLVPLVPEGNYASTGAPLAAIKETPEEEIEVLLKEVENEKAPSGQLVDRPAGARRWTKKAEILAARHGIDLEKIPTSTGFVREADVIAYVRQKAGDEVSDLVEDIYPGNAPRLLIIGGGRGAVQVIDVIHRRRDYRIAGILDDNPELYGKKIMGHEILGPVEKVLEMWENHLFDVLVISFSNALERRAAVYEEYSGLGIPFANVIDPGVSIHSNVTIGEGNVIMAFCRIGSCTVIGNNNFLSAYVNIEHHNELGHSCTFGPGVLTSSRVRTGNRVKFGTGVFVEPGVRIGDDSIIASGSILTADVPARTIVKTVITHKMRKRDG